ncbi:MAG: FG-GAP-like repeat-containing protein [Thermoplasmata archaeon]|nr:FG-GAP-like repeat-containing protein [Thermoplasmata archaeon]
MRRTAWFLAWLMMTSTLAPLFTTNSTADGTEGAAPLRAGHIEGFVLDREGAPLSGATVTFDGGFLTNTDERGFFSSALPAGSYDVMATMTGHSPAVIRDVVDGETVTVHLVPRGWMEAGDEFMDGTHTNTQHLADGVRLAAAVDPVLPQDEWFFSTSNDYMSGSSWLERNDNKGRVWYVDINGDGTFGTKDELNADYEDFEIAVDGYTLNQRGLPMADFDNDGDYDLVIPYIWYDGSWHTTNNLRFVENLGKDGDGHRVFAAPVEIPGTAVNLANYMYDAAVDDFNEDGDWDFIFCGANDDLRFMEGNGDGTFSLHVITNNAPGSQVRGKGAGDVNNDGHADLVMIERTTGGVYVYYGDGAGNFPANPTFLFTAYSELYGTVTYRDPYGLAVADFDNDGTVDIITNDGSPALYSLWLGDGTGAFEFAGPKFDLSNHGAIDPFDIDGDGDMDLLVIESASGGTIWSVSNWDDGETWTTGSIIKSSSSTHPGTYGIATPPVLPVYETTGTYTSSVHDTGSAQSVITLVTFGSRTNANQGIGVDVRSSNDPGMAGASAWEPVTSHDNVISTPAGRYVQYRARFTSTMRSTPVLDSVTIHYQTNPAWVTGTVSNTGGYAVPGARVGFWSGGLEVAWDTSDASGDYRIGVSAGDYSLRAACDDYNPYKENVTVIANALKDIEISYRNFIEHTLPDDFMGGTFDNARIATTFAGELELATNIALGTTVFSNRSSSYEYDFPYMVDGTITRRFESTVNAGPDTGYMNPQWVAIDLGGMNDVSAIDYRMSYLTRFWQNGFVIAVRTGYDPVAGTFSGGEEIVSFPKWTWTSGSECPDDLLLVQGATFRASSGANVSGWLPATPSVNGRYVVISNVYGNDTNSATWHRYRVAEVSVYTPSMTGEYVSAPWNVTDPARQVSCVQWHSDVPAGTTLEVAIRAADTEALLAAEPWTVVEDREHGFAPAIRGQFVQYRVSMSSADGIAAPALFDIMVFSYERPAWILGNVTQTRVGTVIPLAAVHVTREDGQLLPFTVMTDLDGSYIAPVEYPAAGRLEHSLDVSKRGYQDGGANANVTPALIEVTADVELEPVDDWTQLWGNREHTSSTNLPANMYAQGVKWKAYIGGYAGWGVIYDVNLDTRNDLVMVYGDRVVAKTPDNVLLWVGETNDVDRIIGIYDLDKNGIPDIVAAKQNPARIAIINGVNGSLQYEQTWPTGSLHQYAPDNIVVDDFDGLVDGKYEMIVKLNDGRLRAWGFDTRGWKAIPRTMWEIPYAYAAKNSIAVGDVDLDGVKDVVVLYTYGVSVYDAEDGSFKYERTLAASPYMIGGSVIIRDINASDGRGNIIIPYSEPNNNWYQNNDYYTHDGVMVLECNASTIGLKTDYVVEHGGYGNQILWEWMEGCVADPDGDGVLEFVGSMRNISSAAARAGANHWYTVIIDLENGVKEGQYGSPTTGQWEIKTVANLDADPEEEIVLQSGQDWVCLDGNETGYHVKWTASGYTYAYWNRFYKAEQNPAECWFNSGQYYWLWYQVYGPNAHGDIDGDGIDELFLTKAGNITANHANGSALEEVWRFVPPTNNPMPNVYMRDIGNLTGDPRKEAVIVTDDGYLYVVNSTGSYRTVRTGGSRSNIWVADMNVDGIKEILVQLPHETWLTVLNASLADYHNEPVSTPLRHMHEDTHFFIDYDSDGRVELITKNWGTIYCYEWDGASWVQEWRLDRRDVYRSKVQRLYEWNQLRVGNFNGDEYLDIYVRFNNYSYSQPNEWSKYTTGCCVFDGKTRRTIWAKEGMSARYAVVYDYDNDGLDEMVIQDGTTYRVFDPLIGEYIYTMGNSPTYSYGGQMVGNADHDAMDELLVAYQYYSENVIGSAVDMTTGATLWYGGDTTRSTYSAESAHGAAADVDGDGIAEIIQTMTDGRAYCIDDNGLVLWEFDLGVDETVLSPPSAADLDSDGIPEVLFGSSDGYMYVLDGNNGSVDWTFHFGFGSGQPVIVDVDGDDEGEVLISVADGYIYCIDNVDEVELILREKDVESVVNQPDGNTVTIGVDVRNEGGIPATGVIVRFTDNGATFHEETINISRGGVRHLDVKWISHPVGNHTINISVDPEDLIPELDETNNNFTRTIYVWPVPDMAISNKSKWEINPDVTFGLGPFLGHENRLDVTVHNLGPVIAENFYVNLTDNNYTVDSQLITLGAYESGTYSLYWTPVRDPKNLTHTLEIWIDKENRIFESDEMNNHVILKAVTFGPPPEIELRRQDITLSGNVEMPDVPKPGMPEADIGVIEGDRLRVDMTLRNTGFLVAAYVGMLVWVDVDRNMRFNGKYDVYINLDPLYNSRDRWSRSVEIIPSGKINVTQEQPESIRIDTATLRDRIVRKSGTDAILAYPLIIEMDPTDIIPERDNNNKVKIGDLLVIPIEPEVSVRALEVFPDFIDTTIIRVDTRLWVIVRNLGAAPAEGVIVNLTDNGNFVGSVTLDVPCVSHTRAYVDAYAVAYFTFSLNNDDQHVMRVVLDYPGTEAQTIQVNNDAEVELHAVGKSLSMSGLDLAPLHILLVALGVALLRSRARRPEDAI